MLGRIHGLFGVRGWLKVYSYTVPAANILSRPRWWLWIDEAWQAMRMVAGQTHGRTIIAHLASLDGPPLADRDAAAPLVGADIAVARADLPMLDDGKVYWVDLIDCTVTTTTGDCLGRVTDVTDTGAHPLLAVRGERELLIPLVRGVIVQEIDLDNGIIIVDWDAD